MSQNYYICTINKTIVIMNYIEFAVSCPDSTAAEIAMAMLGDMGFDSFQQNGALLQAYIDENAFGEFRRDIEEYLKTAGYRYTCREIRQQNWNSLWESNFEPIDVDGRCMIRAPFHPVSGAEYEVVIMPKMSFGTGHHATTHLMVSAILDHDLSGQRGLDMGSGTGILAILAVKRGAVHVDAVDIDEWAYGNSQENIATNGVEGKVTPILGDVSAIEGRHYDFILANINRNILLADMGSYVKALSAGGVLIVSGILEADISAVTACAVSHGMKQTGVRLRDGWAAVEFVKE